MKLYNPLKIASDTDEPFLAASIIVSVLIFIIGTIFLLLETFGPVSLAIVPVVLIGRVLYAVFNGK